MSLPDLHGYWKYGDAVVPFRLPLAPVRVVAQGYIPRELPTSEISLPLLRQRSSAVQPSNTRSDKVPVSPHDTKEHEHVITENKPQVLDSALDRCEAVDEAVQCTAAEALLADLETEFED